METSGRAYEDIRSALGLGITPHEAGPIRIRLQRLVANAAFVVHLKQDVVVAVVDDLIDHLFDETLLQGQQYRIVRDRGVMEGVVEIVSAFLLRHCYDDRLFS